MVKLHLTLAEALALMKRCKKDLKSIEAQYRTRDHDWGNSSDVPTDFYAVTTDGKGFGVMYFEGDYSAYRETVLESAEDWQPRLQQLTEGFTKWDAWYCERQSRMVRTLYYTCRQCRFRQAAMLIGARCPLCGLDMERSEVIAYREPALSKQDAWARSSLNTLRTGLSCTGPSDATPHAP